MVAEMQTQLYCHAKLNSTPQKSSRRDTRRYGKPSQSWFLNIIVFGPEVLGNKIGAYFERHKMYLQDPLWCQRRVPYRNPHIILSESGDIIMTDSFEPSLADLVVEKLEAGPDLLAQLMADDVLLPETEPPDIVMTPLFL